MGWPVTEKNFLVSMMPWFERVLKLKDKMKEKNLVNAKATCVPPCKGFIVATLAGPKKHIHARCTECKKQMME